MKCRTFGRTGWQVSEVSLGGAYLRGNDPAREQENACEVVHRAKQLGINYLDTAPSYGTSEILLGEALERIHEDFYIATKVGFDPEDFDYSRDLVLWSLERSLRRLRVPKLSLAQIHEVNKAGWERIMEPGGALEGLREAQKQGLCERIGVTGRAIPLLAQLAETGEFDALLVYRDYHPCSQLAAQLVIPKAHEQNMGIVAAMPLAGGLFAEEPRRQRALAALPGEEKREAERVLHILDGQPGTLAQNSFQYILADLRVSTVCGGPASVDELVDIAGASEMGPLAQRSLEELKGGNGGCDE